MASRDNQTMQAIVIVLTLLVIGLGVGLLLVNNAKKTALARASTAESNASSERETASLAQREANTYKQWMGFGEADSLDSLTKLFDEDMQKFGSTFEPDQRFYRKILDYIADENRKIASSEAGAKDDLRQLKERLLALEAKKEAQLQQFQQDALKAKQDLASEKAKFEQDYARINAEKDKMASDLQAAQNKFDQMVSSQEEDKKKLNSRLTELNHSNVILRNGRVDPDPIAQPADGRITWVNQRHGTVWVDIGEADHLRPQVTFAVFGADDGDPVKATKKGSIVIKRILSAHMAEGQITNDIATQPLLPGDRVYSQVWDRGRKVGFAITGDIDIDDDGKSDLDLLKRIVEINNGRVDSVLENSGEISGNMTAHTRYLILGTRPQDPRHIKISQGWDAMSKQADELGVETVTLGEFLNLMGWRPDSKLVKLGAGARASDFKAKPTDNRKIPRASPRQDVFRKRTPPRLN